MTDRWSEVSAAPTLPGAHPDRPLVAADLFTEPDLAPPDLDERLRQTYFWLVNHAVISPYYDLGFSRGRPVTFALGDAGARLELPTDQSYSSNVLLPLLTFAVGGRCLLIGGPGRGKTTVAVLMGVLAGTSWDAVQQGQPQITVSDLVGTPLPRDLVEATSLDAVRIAWRRWLTLPVKVVDEYNRIPTKTQSALLTMVAEGYVETYDQVLRTAPGPAPDAWFFTANDDGGGGTYPVIQALRDRIDVTVGTFGFNSRFLDELVARVEAGERPEDHVPAELRFTDADRAALLARIRAVPVPDDVRRRLEFFVAQFEFVQHGGRGFEYRTKDAVATAGGDVAAVIAANAGADLTVDPGSQTLGGVSVRALQALITYAKAMAFFRGSGGVTVDDVAAVLPFVLRGKLVPNRAHPRFETTSDAELATDPVSWLADLFHQTQRAYDAEGRVHGDPVGRLLTEFGAGLSGLDATTVTARLTAVEEAIDGIARTGKLYGRDYDDLLTCKYLHQRYTNYLRWLESRR